MEKITPQEIIDLVKRLPNSDQHIFEFQGLQNITDEWLVGTFAGCSFEDALLENAASHMIDYLYGLVGHDSMVGMIVTKSGFPNLKLVEQYCTLKMEDL